MAKSRKEKDKRYEERHKKERKAKNIIWGTSVPRKTAEEINEFLKKCGYTKVELIQAGYEELLARHDTAFAKLKDGYDDFFESELTKFAEERNKNKTTLSGEVRAAISDLAVLKYEVLKKVGDAVGNTQAYQL